MNELTKYDAAACGQISAEILELLNLSDVMDMGAQALGNPVMEALWDQAELRSLYQRLLTFYMEERPGGTSSNLAAMFVIRIAAVICYVEKALASPEGVQDNVRFHTKDPLRGGERAAVQELPDSNGGDDGA